MEMTFLTMHDLSPSATVLYASHSIEDVLGYEPEEVVGKSCFDYFHPDELPFARAKHDESIHFDNAAVLSYCRLKNKQAEWIKCECVFTVVYDVFIAATTLYKRDRNSDGRARTAPTIQRQFERPGPLDPRYQMIGHLAPKFSSSSIAQAAVHEPRAAFLLNRFSEKLPILYTTHAAEFVLSCNPEESVGLSFYEFIDEGYLLGAMNAIERAKENDSIAYLRLLWKKPSPWETDESDEHMEDDEDEDEDIEDDSDEYVDPLQHVPHGDDRLEVECLVSSSSDGLIVVVRLAPPLEGHQFMARPPGIFVSPWATSPLALYSRIPPPPPPITDVRDDGILENIPGLRGLPGLAEQDVMDSIRDVSVFVWSIAMLNEDVSESVASNVADEDEFSDEENVKASEDERE